MAPPAVELRCVSKAFGRVKAVDRVSLAVEPGEFFSLLGPSGCGKTTTLRLVAGLERPDEGDILIQGSPAGGRPPAERPLSMVFQSYALFPHLTVERNVAFGLEQRGGGVPRASLAPRVRDALELVRLDPAAFGPRRPAELSGGQRQRVALARALVLEPAILLLDEPLGALDLKLRKEMQLELKALNRRLGITFLYVTHDQEEALAMSDRIAVMDAARIAQVGTPAAVYESPRTAFVAGFIGEANVLHGTASARTAQGWTVAAAGGGTFVAPDHPALGEGRPVRLAVRPEWLDLYRPGEVPAGENAIAGVVQEVVYLGEMIHVLVAAVEGRLLRVALRNEGQLTRPVPWRRGDEVHAGWRPEDCQVLEDA